MKNVVFVDTLDKFYAYGGYGLYNGKNESITMTDKPLVVSVVKKIPPKRFGLILLSCAAKVRKRAEKEAKELKKRRKKSRRARKKQ
ncbi:hypothetical protein KUH03_12880 [Sphingobacterium sp. E70]|uniref:hypothetical protein n=1 Tax=Sphingobacterium sp. E70 TaxID=2853439 RepID=UPI00211CA619|nr:hypothetical protein [Sphingobacterium sp. E70]ULT27531.1 hypothetical protein KUH03_12880 [Sphingobacterium sp. E70]